MDARDICRRLNCSPITFSEWLEKGCPVNRHPPFASYDIALVKNWLDENDIHNWSKESDYDLDSPMRVILRALQNKTITPWQAEKIILNLGSGIWG